MLRMGYKNKPVSATEKPWSRRIVDGSQICSLYPIEPCRIRNRISCWFTRGEYRDHGEQKTGETPHQCERGRLRIIWGCNVSC